MPDVSGIDKLFDYVVPDSLEARVSIGCKVRVVLNGRRVGGWIVDLQREGERAESALPVSKLSEIVSVSGMGVEPSVVPLTKWMSEQWWGTWRATLSSASAPHVREKTVHSRRSAQVPAIDDEVAQAVQQLTQHGSGLLVVPPRASALSAVVALAQKGSVITVCPTQRMAFLGAAALRRRGLSVAVVPDDWEHARAGVDVVIGARSAVLAPCDSLAAIVVIDEHDELLHEERAPTWDASSVAMERASRAGVPCVLTSPTPTLRALHRCSNNTMTVTHLGWPRIRIVDLGDVPVQGSLLSSELLRAVQQKGHTTVCLLNTKGKARLVVCKSCREVQKCSTCESLLEQHENGIFTCRRCGVDRGSVCVSCGRSAFIVPRGGVSQLKAQIQASSVNPVVEVTGESTDEWTKGTVFIGTEAVLYRMTSADTVVFADIDRDLGSSRLSGAFETLSLVAKAARMVPADGEVIIQTRNPEHPLLLALSATDVVNALSEWSAAHMKTFASLGLPPFSVVVRVLLADTRSIDELPVMEGVMVAREESGAILRTSTHDEMNKVIAVVRTVFGTDVRVHADPRRF